MMGLKKDESCRNVCRQLGFLTLPSIYMKEIIKYVKENESDFIKFTSVHSYETTNKDNFQLNKRNKDLVRWSPVIAGGKFYNYLPTEIKEFKHNSKIFMSKVHNFKVQSEFYDVNDFFNV